MAPAVLLLVFLAGACAAAEKETEEPAKAQMTAGGEEIQKEIGTELATALVECPEALEKFNEHRTAAIDGADRDDKLAGQREAYRLKLKAAVEAKQTAGYEALHDTFLVFGAQGLKAMTMVMEGVEKDSKARITEGFDLAELALKDLRALSDEAVVAANTEPIPPGPAEPEYKYSGKSFGMNGNITATDDATNYSLAFSFGMPLWGDLDWGLEAFMSGGGEQDISIGGRLRLRLNIIGLFPSAPWFVPYVGIAGTQIFTGDGTNAIGGEVGVMMFVSRQVAVTFDTRVDATANAREDDPDVTIAGFIGMGIRYTL
jgi:hypothetical protein